MLLLFTNKLTWYDWVCHSLMQFIHAVRGYFRFGLMGISKRFFSESQDFQGMRAPGFCNVKQKKSDIRQ